MQKMAERKMAKLKRETIQELGMILKEEFNYSLDEKELTNMAYGLVEYFDLLSKITNRHKVRKSSTNPIRIQIVKSGR